MDSKQTLALLRSTQKRALQQESKAAEVVATASPRASGLLAMLQRAKSEAASVAPPKTQDRVISDGISTPTLPPAPLLVADDLAEVVESKAPVTPFHVDFAKLTQPAQKQVEEEVDSVAEIYGIESVDEEDDTDDFVESLSTERFPEIMEGVNFLPDPSQEHAIRILAANKSGCLMGAAGTGKTTTTRMLLNALMNGDVGLGIEPMRISRVDLKDYRKKTNQVDDNAEAGEWEDEEMEVVESTSESSVPAIAFTAYTGQATQVLRKNLPPAWRKNAMTIHSMLGFHPVEFYNEGTGKDSMRFEPLFDKNLKMPWDVVIVDEASMVNLELWQQVLDAAKSTTRFYFIGDLNQLPPPIGVGVFGFALTKLPTAELTIVHRQKDEAANKIVDTAWRILKGQQPIFDDPKENVNWRVIGFELAHESAKAQAQVLTIAKSLSQKRVAESIDPATPQIYDPWRDRIMVSGNGFNEDDPASLLGQEPLNHALSLIFADPTKPAMVISAGRTMKHFAVGYRVMATRNEPPDAVNRVTNGMTGKIIDIQPNPEWDGDWRLVGTEDEVKASREIMLAAALGKPQQDFANLSALDLAATNMDSVEIKLKKPGETEADRNGGPSSHIVTVEFDNGATRDYSRNTQVEQLRIAYASTVHKTQGAEMPTAIVVVHHSMKRMLCRESLYTAITRASQRVIILYTPHGMRLAIARQRIPGASLKEKIQHYQEYIGGGDETGLAALKLVDVRLGYDDFGRQV